MNFVAHREKHKSSLVLLYEELCGITRHSKEKYTEYCTALSGQYTEIAGSVKE